MSRNLFHFAILCLFAHSYAHLCLLNPVQRGGYKINEPGDMACFQPDGPCGVAPVENPSITLNGGTSFSVFFQQNLNHYTPGRPGYIEVSWAKGPNPTETDFVPIGYVNDYWSHSQASQTNFSIPVEIPNIDCPHCVIRARYIPHKPTEPIFHQCSDVSIKQTKTPSNIGRFFAWTTKAWDDVASLVEILPSVSLTLADSTKGELKDLSVSSRLRVRSIGQDVSYYMAEGVLAADVARQTIYYLGDTTDSFTKTAPNSIFFYQADSNLFGKLADLNNQKGVWVALVSTSYESSNPLDLPVYLVQQIDAGNYNFYYQVHAMDSNGVVGAPLASTPPNATFVNFFWADYDPITSNLYILSGDENSLTELNVVLYTLNINSRKSFSVNVDHSKYTINSFVVDRTTGALYSISPGLFAEDNGYTIVQLNPTDGSVRAVSSRYGAEFVHNWEGGAYSPLVQGAFYHTFKSKLDNSDYLVAASLTATPPVVYSTALNTGVNQNTRLHSVVYLPPRQ